MIQKYFIAIVPPEPLLSKIQEIKKTISAVFSYLSTRKSRLRLKTML